MKIAAALALTATMAAAFAPSAVPLARRSSASSLFAVTTAQIKELRELTGAGMMDCKKILTEFDGDIEAAADELRKKGLAKADKKASRVAAEGKIAMAKSGGKTVLVEVNCETDFVARNDDFRAFVRDLCLQIAAANPLYISRDQVPEADLAKEREIAAAAVAGKPPAVVQKIVDGKLENFFSTVCLIDQPFVKQNDKSIKDFLSAQIAKTGENIIIRRFTRFQLGA
jgi:elongation factor Ts